MGQHPEDAARNSMMISSDAFIASFQGGITQLLCKQESERCVDQLGEQLEMGERLSHQQQQQKIIVMAKHSYNAFVLLSSSKQFYVVNGLGQGQYYKLHFLM